MAPVFLLPDLDEPLLLPVPADWRDAGEPVGCDCCGRPAPAEQLRLTGSRWLCSRSCVLEGAA